MFAGLIVSMSMVIRNGGIVAWMASVVLDSKMRNPYNNVRKSIYGKEEKWLALL